MPPTKLSLKLLVNKETKKVLFAEAGKDFVDFLLSLLALPLGTVVWLITKKQMVGSLGNLYGSLESLSSTYLQPGIDKMHLLSPGTASPGPQNALLLQNIAYSSAPDEEYFVCSSFSSSHNKPEEVIKSAADNGGYVKGVVTYMVMDDLVISPMSTISSLTLLSKFQVREVGALQEKTVEIGMDEGIKLLKASLHSTTVLSDVLLEKK